MTLRIHAQRGKRGAAVERGRAQFMDPVGTYAITEGGGATYGHRRRLGPSIFFFFLIVYWVTKLKPHPRAIVSSRVPATRGI